MPIIPTLITDLDDLVSLAKDLVESQPNWNITIGYGAFVRGQATVPADTLPGWKLNAHCVDATALPNGIRMLEVFPGDVKVKVNGTSVTAMAPEVYEATYGEPAPTDDA